MNQHNRRRAHPRLPGGELSQYWDRRSTDRTNASPEAARLLPVLTRAIDLGRGPPALVQWLNEKLILDTHSSLECVDGTSTIHQLAMELASRLGSRRAETPRDCSQGKTLTTRDFKTVLAAPSSISPFEKTSSPEPKPATLSTAAFDAILLTEDDPSVRSLVGYILKLDGYEVLEAQSGSEAIDVANAYPGRIALLVTDIFMPEMTGPQLSKSLLARRPDLKVLFLSGSNEEVLAVYGLSEADGQFLQKPFSPTKLLAVVRQILAG